MKHQCSGLAMLLLGVLVGTLAAPSNRTTNDDRSGHREEKRAPPALERLQELHAAGGLVMKMMHAGPGDAAIVNLQKPPIMRKDVENDGWLHSITHDQMDTAGIATLDGFDGVEGLEFQRGGRLAHSRDRTVLEGGRFDWQTGTWMRSAWVSVVCCRRSCLGVSLSLTKVERAWLVLSLDNEQLLQYHQ